MSKRKPQRARQNRQPASPSRQLQRVTDAGKTVTRKGLTLDMLVNEYARLGTGDNLLAANTYQQNRLTQQYALMDALYRGDWIANRIITTIPEDMTKNWLKLTCTVSPDQTAVLENVIRRTHVRERIREGLRWGRLYGGAAAVIMVRGQEDMLDQPLDMEMLMPGDFKGLIVCDRWNGVYPSDSLVDDMDDPDFGLPEYYTFSVAEADTLNGVRVHHSRVLRFTGRDLPYIERIAEQYWGMSEIEHVFAELNKRNSVSANIAQLVFIAHLRVFKMEDLGQELALSDMFTQGDLYNVLSAQNYLMNNMSLQVMSKDDDFQTFDYTFSGLADVYEQFMMDIAGASEIPATKLFGRAPQGMNATGEGDLRNYYDTVRQNQETHLRPVMEKLLPVLCLSAWGAIPDDLDFEFNPIRDTSDEERAGLIQQTANAINSVFNSGIISQKTALLELRQSGTEFGMWTNITDEDIENADDEASPQGEGKEDGMDMPPEAMTGGETDERDEQGAEAAVEEAPTGDHEDGGRQEGNAGADSGPHAARDGREEVGREQVQAGRRRPLLFDWRRWWHRR
ncbi:MAG: DUF1073 domain-containing protein [Oscillospiraceae bacterium]|nr:DUF1073 domain-containing protein [Oscillospiraceae bacterium]